jgi:hypothetical protein
MFEIVNGIADSLIFHPIIFVDFKQHDRNQTCLPVVTMKNIRAFIASEQKFQSGFAKESKPHIIVIATVITTAIKEIVLRARFNEKTQLAMNPATEDITENFATVPGHSEIAIGFMKSPNVVIPHAVVLG